MARTFLIGLFVCSLIPSAHCEGLLPDLSPSQIQQARKTLNEFKSNPKGPYLQIRWYCKDGSVLPPAGTPCASRGGGIQHAELSPAALKLAAWNIDTGTILSSVSFEQLFDAARNHHWLKELVLEKYLTEMDQGWIHRRALYYRGARQVEDEEKAGQRLLVQLLSSPDWLARNYFLANQLVAVIPHGAPDSAVLRIRTLAGAIGDRDPRFQAIRSKIHSTPGAEDLALVEKFLAEKTPPENERIQLAELVALLKQRQSRGALAAHLPRFQKKLAGSPLAAPLEDLASAVRSESLPAVFSTGAALSFEIRRQATVSADGRRNLDLLDLNAALLEKAFETAPARAITPKTRRELLRDLDDYFRFTFGAGLLSRRQFDALQSEMHSLQNLSEPPASAYYESVRYLARSSEWCRATVAKDFAPVMRYYQAFEPAARGLTDHLVRGSMALPLAARLDVLVADAGRAVGIRHAIFHETATGSVVALNPGVTVAKLGIIEAGAEGGPVDPTKMYVIPETVSDLEPMAGILSLDSGNALSHTQLLAANLGIPNATIPSTLLPTLLQHRDQELFFAVTPRGVVVLREKSGLSADEKKLWADNPVAGKPRIELNTSKLNLSDKRLPSLSEIGKKDVGVTVGPKAGNLGQLASYFPAQVSPGLVVPFGIYYDHVNRDVDGSGVPLIRQISAAYEEVERIRHSGAGVEQINRFIYPRLAQFRRAIQTMPLMPAFERQLIESMRLKFGPDGSYGVYVRSDTNAEDLPEFTGAGLNLTVFNQVGNRNILQALKDVWASPFEERAYDWRSRILQKHDRVFPSVLLLRSVPSDKSGVIATANVDTGATDEITVNVSEGPSGVVDGGVAESLLLKPNGEVKLLQQASADHRKILLPAGGFQNVPARGDDYLLAPAEIDQIRAMVAEVKLKYPKVPGRGADLPWDIEFGFEKGQLRLFQIRPLARYREARTLEALTRLEKPADARKALVRLDERIP